MGKVPSLVYKDSDDEVVYNRTFKKKKSKSLKERFRGRSKSEPDKAWRGRRGSSRSSPTSRSSSRSTTPATPLRGILKHTEHNNNYSSEEDSSEDVEEPPARCVVGRVPPRAGARPGRGAGLALVIRRNPINFPSNSAGRDMAHKSSFKRLARKQSY